MWSVSLIFLRRRNQCIEPVIALVPMFLIGPEPGGRLAQRVRFEMAEPCGCLAAAGNEPGLLQHFQMPGDRRLRHAERSRELRDIRVSPRQLREDRATGGIGESAEHGAELISWHP